MRILMVCLGNICRSPIAEGILREKARASSLDWTIDSAGTESFHVGHAPHPFSQKICRMHGIDISAQKARRFSTADFGRYDRIYAMSEDVLDELNCLNRPRGSGGQVLLLLDEIYPGTRSSVPDPWYGPEAGYTQVFDLIHQACDAIIVKYGASHTQQPAIQTP